MLSIFHYVVAGLGALVSLFPSFHLAVGLYFLFGDIPEPAGEVAGEDVPPFPNELFGGIFAGVALMLIVTGLTLSFFVFLAGRKLARHEGRLFCQVVAGILCVCFPVGTVLGIFTLIILEKKEARELFRV